ncbi:zinc finger BED domain-containing protein RICESLEEPER 1-like [Apium graveolens]|uniref:zinc finger BED domain-containing protein RICESLEEPER 1-like n=1 Tax=Apium graveolens TaxID=4045 RepID=UPI003D7B2314
MANAMKEKFDKYWGESNLMMSIGAVMDPRFKLKLLSYCFPVIYPMEGQSEQKLAHLNVVLHDLYQEYVAEDSKIKGLTPDSSQISSSDKYNCSDDKEIPACMNEYEAFIRESGAALEPVKSELDDYLSEGIFILNDSSTKKFDALSWWKGNSAKYPILSRMARDILVVPLSTVTSEATFSAGS